MIEVTELPPASFQACVLMCALATARQEVVVSTVLGSRVQACPGDDPHVIYKTWRLPS